MATFGTIEKGTQVGYMQPFLFNLERWTIGETRKDRWGTWVSVTNEATGEVKDMAHYSEVVESSKEANGRVPYFFLSELEKAMELHVVSDEANEELDSYLQSQY
jgi:hypothetical protein